MDFYKKWNQAAKAKLPAVFAQKYTPQAFMIVTPANFDTFLL